MEQTEKTRAAVGCLARILIQVCLVAVIVRLARQVFRKRDIILIDRRDGDVMG